MDFIYEIHDLEYRAGGRTLSGEFRYGEMATMADRGSVRKETVDPGAFSFAVEDRQREINLLVGHSFDQPLASKLAGSLLLDDSAQGLQFRATLPPENRQPTWMRDAVLAINAGLIRGVSPGFKVPPADVVQDAEVLEDEPGNPGVQIRRVRAAVLFELSLVTRPAYPNTEVDIRQFQQVDQVDKVEDDFERYRRWL